MASYVDWQLSLQIPWLVNNPVGAAYANVFGSQLDNQTTIWEQVIKSSMPLEAPPDALPIIAQTRNLIQGPTETEEHFRVRLQNIWQVAPFYGTGLGMLLQLAYQGYTDGYDAYMISSPGLVLSLNDPLNEASANFPADQLNIQYAMENPAAGDGYYFSMPIRSWLHPIPVNFWNWSTSNPFGVQQNNRFVLLFNAPPSVWSGGVPSQSQLNIIQSIVDTWKPARAIFEGIIVKTGGKLWGWPLNNTWGTGTWGGTVSYYLSDIYGV
jgi:hypothetical protein